MFKQLIGIAGRRGAGKSRLAASLADSIPGSVILPFSHPIKTALIAMGLPGYLFYTHEEKGKAHPMLQYKTPRFAMQTLGTEWGRNLMGPNFWADIWEENYYALRGDLCIVDDVRFESEVLTIQRLGGFVVAVRKTNELPLPKWWEVWKEKPHESERLDFEDLEIPELINDGTPEQLLARFHALRSGSEKP